VCECGDGDGMDGMGWDGMGWDGDGVHQFFIIKIKLNLFLLRDINSLLQL